MTQGFSNVKLRGVLEERSGITWGKEQESQTPLPGAMPVLTVTNVQETLETEPMLYIRGVSERDRQRKAAKQGWTIAVGSNGNRGRIGNCVFIERDTEYLFASFLVAFRPKPDSGIDAEYFYRWMSSYEIQARLSASSEGTTGLGNLSTRYFRNLWISYPTDSREQARVVELLRLVDTAIATAGESIAKAERLQKGLMQQLLTGRLKPDGTPRSPDEFWAEPKLGLVPKGWIVEKGWKIADKITKGQSPKWQGFDYTSSGMLFVTSENVRDGFLDLSEPKYLPVEFNEKIKGSELQTGDILINLVGASIGRSCLFDADHRPANVNQAVCVFRPKPGIVSRYLAYYLRLHSTQNRLLSSQVETARSNLSLGDVRRLKFVLPQDEQEQKEIAERVHHITRFIDAKQQKIAALQRLKKSLMQNLLTGRIRLPVDGAVVKEGRDEQTQ